MPSGPIVMLAAGDRFTDSCCISTVIWEGATSSGDVAELQQLGGGGIIWGGRTTLSHTYIGANLGTGGVSCPYGFSASKLSSGRLLIYLRGD